MMKHLHDRVFCNPALYERMELEADRGSWAACILTEAGPQWIRKNALIPVPDALRAEFAHDMVQVLNKALHHDGVWAVCYCNLHAPTLLEGNGLLIEPYYTRLVILWMDADGDVRFPIESDSDIVDILVEGMDAWVSDCESAWQQWNFLMVQDMPVNENTHYRRALGERPKSQVPQMLEGVDDLDEKGKGFLG